MNVNGSKSTFEENAVATPKGGKLETIENLAELPRGLNMFRKQWRLIVTNAQLGHVTSYIPELQRLSLQHPDLLTYALRVRYHWRNIRYHPHFDGKRINYIFL